MDQGAEPTSVEEARSDQTASSEGANDSPRMILISSVSGLAIDDWMTDLVFVSRAEKLSVNEKALCVEDKFVECAEPILDKLGGKKPGGWSKIDVLKLPFPELVKVCAEAFRRTAKKAADEAQGSGAGFVLVSFHPVLYHQISREFIAPYASHRLAGDASQAGVTLDRIVSVHDDVYDVFRRLLGEGRLFDPRTNREPRLVNGQRIKNRDPVRDIEEQFLVLSWRDRELASARSLAAGANTRHLLFHRKGRLDSLAQILFARAPFAYFSHPISQPRRDILEIPDQEKCRTPDPQRGYELIKEVQVFANRLAEHVPLIEPTCIDEFRMKIAKDRKSEVQENEEEEGSGRSCRATANRLMISADELATHILPPVNERWPLGDGRRAGGGAADTAAKDDGDLLRVPPGVFANLSAEPLRLVDVSSALVQLQKEMKRQINVRDHILAEQADLVVAFRPYSLPDSAEPTGGVEKEIAAVKRVARLGRGRSRPAVVIFHPPEDERRRRQNEFNAAWDQKAAGWFEEPEDDHVKALKVGCREAMVRFEARNGETGKEGESRLQKELRQCVDAARVTFRVAQDKSSMNADHLGLAEDAIAAFLDELVTGTAILRSTLETEASALQGLVSIRAEREMTPALALTVQSLMTKGQDGNEES